MQWIRSQEQPIPHFKSSVLTIGNFDGVHLGHQKLLNALVHLAKENNTVSVALTFKPHPRTVLRPDLPHHRMFDYRDQVEMMGKIGVDCLVEEKFSKDFSLMSAEEFLTSYILKIYNPVHIVVGYDFNFGKSRDGNIEYLREFCQKRNIGFTVIEAFQLQGQIVSSSRIRNFLEHGELEKAESYLGRRYYLRGPIRVGYKRGRVIGTPTANISPEIEFIPRKGVYFTESYLRDKKFYSITNIGVNPTFENSDSYIKVETHIFNFDEDIYGEHLRIELIRFYRDEIKFNSIDALKFQIANDLSAAKKFLGIS